MTATKIHPQEASNVRKLPAGTPTRRRVIWNMFMCSCASEIPMRSNQVEPADVDNEPYYGLPKTPSVFFSNSTIPVTTPSTRSSTDDIVNGTTEIPGNSQAINLQFLESMTTHNDLDTSPSTDDVRTTEINNIPGTSQVDDPISASTDDAEISITTTEIPDSFEPRVLTTCDDVLNSSTNNAGDSNSTEIPEISQRHAAMNSFQSKVMETQTDPDSDLNTPRNCYGLINHPLMQDIRFIKNDCNQPSSQDESDEEEFEYDRPQTSYGANFDSYCSILENGKELGIAPRIEKKQDKIDALKLDLAIMKTEKIQMFNFINIFKQKRIQVIGFGTVNSTDFINTVRLQAQIESLRCQIKEIHFAGSKKYWKLKEKERKLELLMNPKGDDQ